MAVCLAGRAVADGLAELELAAQVGVQAWHRDSIGSNTTDGLRIDFTP